MFDGAEHVPLATLPGDAERTLTISSAGKTFSVTGMEGGLGERAGGAGGRRPSGQAVPHVRRVRTVPAGRRAWLSRLPDACIAGLAADLQAKRDLLVGGLRNAGIEVAAPDGTYFVTADAAPLGDGGRAVAFCRDLPARVGVVGVPVRVFHDDRRQRRRWCASPSASGTRCWTKRPAAGRAPPLISGGPPLTERRSDADRIEELGSSAGDRATCPARR